MKKSLTICTIAIAFVLFEADPILPATLTVVPPGTIRPLGDVYPTIQAAIDDANAGDTIVVHSGTYEEDLTITVENLELSGNGADIVIIKGIDTEPWGNWPLANPNIDIQASGVKIHGFTIQSPDVPDGNYSSGIVLTGADIEIYDNNFVSNAAGDGGCVVIQTYRDNVTGYESDISGLDIHDNDFTGSPGGGYVGVFINHTNVGSGTATVQNNALTGNIAQGVVTERSNTTIHGNNMASDMATGSRGIIVMDWNTRDQNAVTISNNTITGCEYGIRIGDSAHTQVLTNISITGSTLQSNDVGIQVRSSADGVVANQNKINGNTTYGVENTDAAILDATLNWWGHLTGPYHPTTNPAGQGNEVSDNVDYYPWYTSEDMVNPVVVYIGDTPNIRAYAETIQEGIDAAYEGDTIVVSAGTYPEYLHITKDGLAIEGAGIDASIINLEGLTPYWHYSGCSSSFASRAGVLISGYGSDDEVVEDITFSGFTVKNAGLNPPITATGTHTDPNDAATLTDANASWTPGELVGQWIHNYGDRDVDYDPARSYGQITANTETTVTATLSGGLENDWDTGDAYLITPYEEFHNSWWVHYPNYDWVRGISIGNANGVLIQNCKIHHNGYGGISTGYARCVSTHKYSENITIDNCIVTDHQRAGIGVGNHAGAFAITNNTCERNKSPHYADATREYCGYGIQVSGRNSSLMASGLIYNNTCNDNGFEGIIVDKYTDGVTVKKNTVTGHNLDQDGAGIFLYHWGHPEFCKNHDVNDNTVTGNIRGIVAYYVSDSTIQNNTITTDSGSFDPGQGAIKLDGCSNTMVKNNTISCDGTGMSVVYWEGQGGISSSGNTFTGNSITDAKFAGIFISGDAHDNTFTGNTITGTTILTRWAGEAYEETQGDGVFIDDDAGTGNVFNCNKIYDNNDDGMENQTTTTVDATYNWWGDASGPSGQGGGTGDSVSEYVEFFPWLLNDNIEDCNAPTEIVADIVVDDNWAPLPEYTQVFVGSTDYYIGLNAFAVIQDAVDATDPCDKTIYVLEGSYDQFTVDAKNDLTITSASTVVVEGVQSVTTAYGDRDCVIFVKGSTGIVLNDLDIQGNGLGTINTKNYGVIYESSTGKINECTVSPNTVGDMSSTAIGIWDGSQLTVGFSTLENFGRIGILVYNATDAEILNNTIIGQVYSGEGEVCYGIEVEGAYNDEDPATASRATIKRNEIYNCDNTFDPEPSWASSAIYINGWMAYYPEADSTVIIQDNDIHDNYNAIYAVKSPSSRANFNAIYNNRVSGIESDAALDATTAVLDAEYNWWTDVSGPNDPNGTNETDGINCYDVATIKNADGLGDAVSENVDYCPWLLAPISPSDIPCPAGDLDFDCDVDWSDFAKFANNWLEGVTP